MFGLSATAERMGDWHGYADAEELRMLHVIAGFATDEAIVHGAYGAAFRGFYVSAVREAMTYGLCVRLTVSGRQGVCAVDVPTRCAMIICTNELDEPRHAQLSSR
jgi:hypothetical protein